MRCPRLRKVVLALLTVFLAYQPALATENDQEQFDFSIPAQALIDSLREFSKVTGVQVLVPQNDVDRYQTEELNGTFSALEGLQQMTAATGLTVKKLDERTLSLELDQWAKPESTANAQPNEVEEMLVLGYRADRVVGSSKTITPRIEVAQSVELFTRERMDDEGMRGIDDVLRRSNSVGQVTHYGVTMRGFSAGTGQGRDYVLYDGLAVSSAGRRFYRCADQRRCVGLSLHR